MDKNIRVYREEGCYNFPTNLIEFIAFWQQKLDEIPSKHRASAYIDMDEYERYGDPTLDTEIHYIRPETKTEGRDRLACEAKEVHVQTVNELAELQRLQQKYSTKQE